MTELRGKPVFQRLPRGYAEAGLDLGRVAEIAISFAGSACTTPFFYTIGPEQLPLGKDRHRLF